MDLPLGERRIDRHLSRAAHLADRDRERDAPIQTLAGFTLVAILAGVAAAIMPARWASRLNVLDALQYD